MTTQTKTLTPSQFIAARALARAYNHLWSGVPDGTFAVSDILAWSRAHANSIPGIDAPWTDTDESLGTTVSHSTGSGRLNWTIDQYGTCVFEINRPNPEQARINTAVAEKADSNVVEWSGYEVARITVFNGNLDSMGIGSREHFSVGEIELDTCDYAKSHDVDGQVAHGWNYNEDLREDLLFERHVAALVRPLVALLTVNEQEERESESVPENETPEERDTRWEANHARYQEWRKRVIVPAIEKAKEILAPLFDLALPDPWRPAFHSAYDGHDCPEQKTYWSYEEANEYPTYHPQACYTVVHNGEDFPVESEKTAVYAVLLLQQKPEMPLVEAVKSAIRSSSYRP